MPSIGSYLCISHQNEILLWSILGFLRNSFDVSLFSFTFNLEKIWQLNLSDGVFSLPLQHLYKTLMTAILLLQTFTVHAYLATYVIMIYPIIYDERPSLLLPWLVVSAVKGLLSELLGLATGLGVCVAFGGLPRPCVIFVLERILVLIPNIYMWMLVFNFYLVMSSSKHTRLQLQRSDEEEASEVLDLATRRRQTRSILHEEPLSVASNTVTVKHSDQSTAGASISAAPSRLGSGVFGMPKLISRLSRDHNTTSLGTSADEQEERIFARLDLHPRLEGDRVLDQLISLVQRASILSQHPDLQEWMASETVSENTFFSNTPLTTSHLRFDRPFRSQSPGIRNNIVPHERALRSDDAFSLIVASELAGGHLMLHVTSTLRPRAAPPRYISEFPNIFQRRRTFPQYSPMSLVPPWLSDQDQRFDQNVMTSPPVVLSTSAGSFNNADVTDTCTQVSDTSVAVTSEEKCKRYSESSKSIECASSTENELVVATSEFSQKAEDNSLGDDTSDDDEEHIKQ